MLSHQHIRKSLILTIQKNFHLLRSHQKRYPLSVPVCLQIMLKDISLTSCGHHFCTSCIKRIHGSCPTCRGTSYQIFPDIGRQHYIRGLKVYCSNKKDGCTWKGELKTYQAILIKAREKETVSLKLLSVVTGAILPTKEYVMLKSWASCWSWKEWMSCQTLLLPILWG